MIRRFALHLRDQWMGALALFLVLSGGTAYALAGSDTVFSDDIVNNTVTGSDINEKTLVGVNRCPSPLTVKLGKICAGSDGGERTWPSALQHCASLNLRLPTLAEAITLAMRFDVPGVTESDLFWTDNFFINELGSSVVVEEDGERQTFWVNSNATTVCVMIPTS